MSARVEAGRVEQNAAEALSSSQRDAEVAVRVMGWIHHPGSAPFFRWEQKRTGPNGNYSLYRAEMSRYSTDVAADYSVLEHLRRAWATPEWVGPAMWWDFQRELLRIWQDRAEFFADGEKSERTGWVAWFAQYQPGDYSRAALAALDSSASARPGDTEGEL